MSQGKTYTFQRQGLENTIISVVRGQGKSGNFFSKICIHPGLQYLVVMEGGGWLRNFDMKLAWKGWFVDNGVETPQLDTLNSTPRSHIFLLWKYYYYKNFLPHRVLTIIRQVEAQVVEAVAHTMQQQQQPPLHIMFLPI